MFDLEKAGHIKLRDVETTSETMIKASGTVGDLDAERCKSGVSSVSPVVEDISKLKKVIRFLCSNIKTISISVISGLIVLFIGRHFLT